MVKKKPPTKKAVQASKQNRRKQGRVVTEASGQSPRKSTMELPPVIASSISNRPLGSDNSVRLANSLKQIPAYQLAVAEAAYRELRERILTRIDDIRDPTYGLDCGPKIVNNAVTNLPCVRVFVRKKKPLSKIAKSERIEKYYGGVPTDVVEISRVKTAAPIQGSDEMESKAPPGAFGRIGVMVLGISDTVAASGSIMLLTAAHVAQGNRSKNVLDRRVSLFDRQGNVIGNSIPNFVDHGTITEYNWQRDEFLDAALIAPTDDDALPGIRGHAGVPINFLRAEEVVPLLSVEFLLPGQVARQATVESVFGTFMANSNGRSERITDHILVRRSAAPFVARGDSGGLVVTPGPSRAAVGIVRAVFDAKPALTGTSVAVSDNPEFALLSPMHRIVGIFHVFPTDHLNN